MDTETNKAIGYFKQMQEEAKNKYDNARNAYDTALEAETAGYGESRKEKISALEDMYKASKEMLDNYKKEQDAYQKKKGNIYKHGCGGVQEGQSTIWRKLRQNLCRSRASSQAGGCNRLTAGRPDGFLCAG